MTHKKLESILKGIDLDQCQEIIPDQIYYIKKKVRTQIYRNLKRCYDKHEYEFLIIASNNIKQAIILRCGDMDLHWFVLRKYRGQHILSNALRTGVIQQVWPENKFITCAYGWDGEGEDEDYQTKLAKTKHLAEIANLTILTDKEDF